MHEHAGCAIPITADGLLLFYWLTVCGVKVPKNSNVLANIEKKGIANKYTWKQ